MHASKRLAIGLCCLCGLVAERTIASDERSLSALAGARTTYEKAIESLRKDVNQAIDAKIDAANNSTNREKVEEAGGEKKEFAERGTLPDLPATAAFEKKYALAAKDLDDAYVTALATTAKSVDSGLHDALAAESETFAKQWDLNAWQEKLTQNSPTESERTQSPGGEPLKIDIGTSGDYRIAIVAKRIGDAGSLSVDLPLADGKRIILLVPAGDKGDIDVLLNIHDGEVTGERGIVRPIDVSRTSESDITGVNFGVEGGTFRVEAVRVKAIQEGAPPKLQELAKRQENRQAKVDPLPQGASGHGDFYNHNAKSPVDCVVTVLSRDGKKVVLGVVKPSTGESFRVAGFLNRNSLSVDAVEQTRPPNGAPAFIVSRVEGGGGTVSRDGLDIRWSVRGRSPPALAINRVWTVTLRNVKLR